jgi:hypothetical protein
MAGKKITDLTAYGSIDLDASKKDMFEVTKNDGTSASPSYPSGASRKVSGEDLRQIIQPNDYLGELEITGSNIITAGYIHYCNVSSSPTMTLPTILVTDYYKPVCFIKTNSNTYTFTISGAENSDVTLTEINDYAVYIATSTGWYLLSKIISVDLSGYELLSNKSIDGNFTLNSDTLYPSQKAVKTYVDGLGNSLTTALSGKLSIASNLSDLANASTARTNLGLAIGTNVQAWDADLDAIAALSGTSGFLKKTAANTWSLDTNTYLSANGLTSTYIPYYNGSALADSKLTVTANNLTYTESGNAIFKIQSGGIGIVRSNGASGSIWDMNGDTSNTIRMFTSNAQTTQTGQIDASTTTFTLRGYGSIVSLTDGTNSYRLISGDAFIQASNHYIRDASGNQYMKISSGGTYIGTSTISSSAIFQADSTTKGSLGLPRMTSAQFSSISSPAQGLGAFDTDLRSEVYLPVSSGNAIRKSGVMFTQSANKQIQNTTTETSLIGTGIGSVTIKGNSSGIGTTYRITMWGYISNTGSPFCQVKIKIGSVTIFDTTSTGMFGITGNQPFKISALFTVRTLGATGTVIGQGEFEYATSSSTAYQILFQTNTSTSTIDTTTDQAIDITYTWNTANASNSINSTNFLLERL